MISYVSLVFSNPKLFCPMGLLQSDATLRSRVSGQLRALPGSSYTSCCTWALSVGLRDQESSKQVDVSRKGSKVAMQRELSSPVAERHALNSRMPSMWWSSMWWSSMWWSSMWWSSMWWSSWWSSMRWSSMPSMRRRWRR